VGQRAVSARRRWTAQYRATPGDQRPGMVCSFVCASAPDAVECRWRAHPEEVGLAQHAAVLRRQLLLLCPLHLHAVGLPSACVARATYLEKWSMAGECHGRWSRGPGLQSSCHGAKAVQAIISAGRRLCPKHQTQARPDLDLACQPFSTCTIRTVCVVPQHSKHASRTSTPRGGGHRLCRRSPFRALSGKLPVDL